MSEKTLIKQRGYNPYARVMMIIIISAMINLLIFPGAVEERLQDAPSLWGSQYLLTVVKTTKVLAASIGLDGLVDTIRKYVLTALQ